MANVIKLIGFAPDLDPSTPGILIDCQNLLPTPRGMIPAPSPVASGMPALSSAAQGAVLMKRVDGTPRSIVGTATKLIEDSGGTWVDRTRPTAAYTGSTESVWRFTSLGDACIATNGADKVQSSIDGVFTDIPVSLVSITPTTGGSGYTSVPTVTVSGPDVVTSNFTALAHAVLTGGVVTSIVIDDPGSGYTKPPTVTITGGGGTGATATATIVDVPVGAIVTICAEQVFVLNLSHPDGQMEDSWFCSGVADYTDWTPNPETLCAYGRIFDTPGGITAAKPLNNQLVVYKQSSMYLGSPQSSDIIWTFQNISTEIGATCQEAVISIGTSHYFPGPDNFYMYQAGGQPIPIGDNIKEWFFDNQAPTMTASMASYYDPQKNLLYWGFVSTASTDSTIDKCLVYNWKTGMWGRHDLSIQCFVQAINGQITFDNLGTQWPTWDDLPDVPYDSSYWTYTRLSMGYFGLDNSLYTLTGFPTTSSFTTCDFGDDDAYSRFQQIKMRFNGPPSAGTGTWYGRANLGDIAPNVWGAATGAMFDNTFDVDQSARWHRIAVALTGSYELIGFIVKMVQEGNY